VCTPCPALSINDITNSAPTSQFSEATVGTIERCAPCRSWIAPGWHDHSWVNKRNVISQQCLSVCKHHSVNLTFSVNALCGGQFGGTPLPNRLFQRWRNTQRCQWNQRTIRQFGKKGNVWKMRVWKERHEGKWNETFVVMTIHTRVWRTWGAGATSHDAGGKRDVTWYAVAAIPGL
jgi:hypothetical protein